MADQNQYRYYARAHESSSPPGASSSRQTFPNADRGQRAYVPPYTPTPGSTSGGIQIQTGYDTTHPMHAGSLSPLYPGQYPLGAGAGFAGYGSVDGSFPSASSHGTSNMQQAGGSWSAGPYLPGSMDHSQLLSYASTSMGPMMTPSTRTMNGAYNGVPMASPTTLVAAPYDIPEPKSPQEQEISVACRNCGKVLTGPHATGNLTRHQKSQDCASNPRRKEYPCSKRGCGKIYQRSDGLLNHMRKAHNAPGPFKRNASDEE